MPRETRSYNRISGVRDPSLIIIATEGSKTEVQYFNALKEKLDQNTSSRIKVHVLEREESGNSSPRHIINQLDKHKRKYGVNSSDEFCMIIDRDRQSWPTSTLSDVAAQCCSKGYLLLVSNPCFELWLLLHHVDINTLSDEDKLELLECSGSQFKKKLRNAIGSYNPAKIDIDDFYNYTHIAIERDKQLDVSPSDRWPNNLCSRVYKIVEKILPDTF